MEGDGSSALKGEEQTVILVAHKTDAAGRQRTRRLFTTLNRYAVRVSPGELIALSEDGTFAVVARRLVDEYPGLNSDFVPLYKTANLPRHDKQSLTSLITLYSVVKVLAVPTGKHSPRHLIHGPAHDADPERIFAMQVEFWDALKAHFSAVRVVCGSKPEAQVAARFRHLAHSLAVPLDAPFPNAIRRTLRRKPPFRAHPLRRSIVTQPFPLDRLGALPFDRLRP